MADHDNYLKIYIKSSKNSRSLCDAGGGDALMSKNLMSSVGYNPGKGQFLVYEAEDGQVKIDVRLEDETVWLTRQLMADLFQSSKQNI